MASMGRRSLTKRAWKAQKCFATDARRFLGRAVKRHAKARNGTELRRQGRAACAALRGGDFRVE